MALSDHSGSFSLGSDAFKDSCRHVLSILIGPDLYMMLGTQLHMFVELPLEAMAPEMSLLANRKARAEPSCACFHAQQRKVRTAENSRELWEVLFFFKVNSESEKSTDYGIQIDQVETTALPLSASAILGELFSLSGPLVTCL